MNDTSMDDNAAKITENILKMRPKQPIDMVNHPPHYQLNNGIESIDVIRGCLTEEEYKGWCKGNALKYQFRAGKKDPSKTIEDYKKAMFFLNELVK